MPKITIKGRPDLTPELVFQVFKKHFGDRYTVYERPGGTWAYCDFAVKKSIWQFAGVEVKRRDDRITIKCTVFFQYYFMMPLMGLWPIFTPMFLSFGHKLKAFMASAEELQGQP